MDTKFPNFDSYLIIEDSSSEEEGEPRKTRRIPPLTVPPDQDVKNAIDALVTQYFDKNKYLFERQVQLCDEYLDRQINQCLLGADELDKLASDLQDEMTALRNEIYEPYEPIVTCLEPVDINELLVDTEEEKEEVEKPIQEIKTPKVIKRIKLRRSDKEDVITINRTVCTLPANLPREGLLDYPSVEIGQVVYAMKLNNLQPWCRCKIRSIINHDYVHIRFDKDEKLLTTKEVAFITLNPVRFPVGCRIIAKYKDTDSKHAEEFYAGVVAEPPKMLNDFR